MTANLVPFGTLQVGQEFEDKGTVYRKIKCAHRHGDLYATNAHLWGKCDYRVYFTRSDLVRPLPAKGGGGRK